MSKKKKKAKEPTCNECSEELVTKLMTIAEVPCWNCGTEVKVAFMTSEPMAMLRGHTTVPPSHFLPQEIEFAKSKGVNLKLNFSKTIEKSYVANTCDKCNSFCGDFFLFEDYVIPVHDKVYPSEVFKLDLICPDCDDRKYTKGDLN